MTNLEMIVTVMFKREDLPSRQFVVRADTLGQASEKALIQVPESLSDEVEKIKVEIPARTREGNPNDGWSYSGPGGYRTHDPWGYCDNPARGY